MSQPTNTGHTKLARRKNNNGFGYAHSQLRWLMFLNCWASAAKVSRADLGTFQDGVFHLPTTDSAPAATAQRNQRKNNKPMSKSLEVNGSTASINSKPVRSKSASGKHLSFAPESTLVQIHTFPPTSPTSYSSIAEDSASSTAAPKAHWAGGAYANSPDPTSIPLPSFGAKHAAPPSTAAPSSAFAAQASLDLRRMLNIPTPPQALPLNVTA